MQEVVLEVLGQTAKSKVCLVLCDGKKMVRKELLGSLPVYEVLQNLHHPYLPELFQVEEQNGQTIVWEEYIEGQSLFEAKLPHKALLAAFIELCTVLDFLHKHKVVHRDIKPSNLRLATDGHIRLIDFDAARVIKEEQEQDTRMLGTRGYAPPEQYGYAQTDERADIYALGVTIRQLLGNDISSKQKRILARCTELKPERRYSDALSVRRALRRSTSHLGIVAASILLVAAAGAIFWAKSQMPAPMVSTVQTTAGASDLYERRLLYYSEDSDYIYVTASDLLNQTHTQYMAFDFAQDGVAEELLIHLNAEGNIVVSANTYNSKASKKPDDTKLFWEQSSENLLYNILSPLEDFGENSFSYQVSCVDVDQDGVRELLISKGDHSNALVTELYRFSEDRFLYVGTMWGYAKMRSNDAGCIYTDFDPDYESSCYNFYKYVGGELIEIRVADPQAYRDAEELSPYELHQRIAGRKNTT